MGILLEALLKYDHCSLIVVVQDKAAAPNGSWSAIIISFEREPLISVTSYDHLVNLA